jgi:hypothetical protein
MNIPMDIEVHMYIFICTDIVRGTKKKERKKKKKITDTSAIMRRASGAQGCAQCNAASIGFPVTMRVVFSVPFSLLYAEQGEVKYIHTYSYTHTCACSHAYIYLHIHIHLYTCIHTHTPITMHTYNKNS